MLKKTIFRSAAAFSMFLATCLPGLDAGASFAEATADTSNDMNTYGAEETTTILAGESFAGLTSTVTSTSGLGTSPRVFNSTMSILAGKASKDTTVSVKWRAVTDAEYYGTSTVPPLNDSGGFSSLLSDVVDLNIYETGTTPPTGTYQTDVYVLQMTYEGGSFLEDYVYEYGSTIDWTEQDIIDAAELWITFYDSTTGFWSDEDLGNFGVGTNVIENYFGSWSSFATQYGVTDDNLGDFLGSWGVEFVEDDPNTTDVDESVRHIWAVLDHTTPFATSPEPSTASLILLAGMGMIMRRGRQTSR